MVRRLFSPLTLACVAATGLVLGAAAVHGQEGGRLPLALNTARVTIAGTSNIHAYTASTTVARVIRAQIAPSVAGPAFWEEVVKPDGLQAFEVAIPAAKLASEKDGLDKNMHKALKVQEFPDITFRLSRVEPGVAGAMKAIGILKIAGVEREVALDLKTQRNESSLTVKGELKLLMTDYGIKPPTAMLGMLKTDPKVTVTFETVLSVPLT